VHDENCDMSNCHGRKWQTMKIVFWLCRYFGWTYASASSCSNTIV